MRLTPEQRTEVLERHLHDHGHVDRERMDDAIADATAGNGPSEALGARIVARAWVDPEFRARLLADAVGAVAEYQQQAVPLAVLQDTQTVHHVIVCTLCSCYRAASSVNRPPGTRASSTAAGSSANRGRCSPSSGWMSSPGSSSACTIRRPSGATWCCHCDRAARTAGTWTD